METTQNTFDRTSAATDHIRMLLMTAEIASVAPIAYYSYHGFEYVNEALRHWYRVDRLGWEPLWLLLVAVYVGIFCGWKQREEWAKLWGRLRPRKPAAP